jgi:hypothetical protein
VVVGYEQGHLSRQARVGDRERGSRWSKTDVGYLGDRFNIGVAPSTVDRNTATVVGFNISVTPGDNTDYLTIMTNAKSTGSISFASAGGAQTVAGFAPTVPEPSARAMMLLGFAGLAFAGYRAVKGVAPA